MNTPAPTHLFRLDGKRALVTGASNGLGRAMALGLAQAGADLAVVARSGEALENLATEIKALRRKAFVKQLDLREQDKFKSVVQDIETTLGPIDILVNCAGIESVAPSETVSPEKWDLIVDTNLKATFFLTQAVGNHMLQRGAGSIINICSLTSFVGVPTAAPYGASKSGLLGLTRTLSTEWAPRGLRVNAIAPGYFRTSMTEVFYQNKAWAKSMLQKIPQARFGKAEDLIGPVVFLASDASAYVTGQCIAVDGGYLSAI